VVASSRRERNDKNGTILHADGRPSHSFALGDGIEHVRCAPDGTLWVGYFDEGVFGNTLGSGGIVRFDAQGQPEWSYNDAGRRDGAFIDDCYAMSLCGHELWACYYSDFAITRIADGHDVRWENSIAGAKALATDGSYALLAGGYGDDADRIAVLELDASKARVLGTFRHPALIKPALVQGRSSTLHIVNNGEWLRLTLAEARNRLEQ
jgi:hypothetical protein